MRYTKRIPAAVLAVTLLAGLSLPTAAQQGSGLTGWLHLGFRTLDVSGGTYAQANYDEDVDYRDGVRLMGLGVSGQAAGSDFGVSLYGWGLEADPTSTMKAFAKKSGLYSLEITGWNARYIHTTASLVDDYSLIAPSYDYMRRGRTVKLDLPLGTLPDVYLLYDRFTRSGSVSQAWNIEREKFSALTPVDETFSTITVGTSFPVAIAAVQVSYALHSLENSYGATVDGPNDGLDGRPASLDSYSHIITDDGSLPVLKLNAAAPVGPATVRVGFATSSGTVDKQLDEVIDGLDYEGNATTGTSTLTGSLDRSFTILDGGIALSLPAGLTLDFSGRQTSYEVDGVWDEAGSDTDVGTTVLTNRIMGRFIWRPTRGVSVDFGGAYMFRDFEATSPGDLDVVTESTDFVGGLSYTRQDWFTLRLRHTVGEITDPFTRLSPTDRNSTRASVTVKPLDWLNTFASFETGEATRYYSENESDPQYYFNTRTGDVRSGTVGFTIPDFPWLEGLHGSASYSRGSLELTVPISVQSPPTPPIFEFRDVTYGVNGELGYRVAEGLDVVAGGSWFRAKGQWPLYRFSRHLAVTKELSLFTLRLDVRQYSFNEVAGNRDDYDANVITLGLIRGF